MSSTNQTVDQQFYIQFTFKTSHSEGILFYTGKQGQMFLTSYIQDGVLQFKVLACHRFMPILKINFPPR